MKFSLSVIPVLAATLLLGAAPVSAANKTALDASPDSCGLLVLDLKAPSRNFGLTQGMNIDGCSMAIVFPGGAGWDLGSMTTASSIAGSLVFAAKPGHYRLFAATGSTSAGKTWVRAELSFLNCPLPQLTVEIRKGEVAYLGTVKALVHPFRETDFEVVLDAEREQKLLAKLAEKAVKSPWGPQLLRAASTEWVAADLAAARARASAPAESLPAVPVMRSESVANWKADLEQAAIYRDSVMARAPRAPVEGRRPEDRLLWMRAGNKQALIDTLGRVVVEPEFDYTSSGFDGRAMVSRDGLWGYVDGTGRIVIELKWQESSGFGDGLARVVTGIQFGSNRAMGAFRKNSGHSGWIDRDGNVVIPTRFTQATDFSEGLAWVSEDACRRPCKAA